jgi:ATP-binding cassette subfamily C protein LapB
MTNLLQSLRFLANLQRTDTNIQQLKDIVGRIKNNETPLNVLLFIAKELLLKTPKKYQKTIDKAELPLLLFDGKKWGVLKSITSQNQLIVQFEQELVIDMSENIKLFSLNMKAKLNLSNSTTFQMVKDEMLKHKKLLIDAFIAGIFINIVAVVSAFYSMQIYDRVVPTGAKQTLMVLTIGVIVVIFLEFIAKLVRSGLYEKLIEIIDKKLSSVVYQRFLSLRLDQLPKSVGTLSGQMRGYESVRGFLSSIASYLMVDVPFVLFYVFLIFMIGGYLALIPIIFFILALVVGIYFHKKIEYLANNINEAVNLKTGLLVESIEGAESIKSGQGGWRMLAKWNSISDSARYYDLEMKRVNEHSQYIVALFQQTSFVSMVAFGSLMIGSSGLTMGGLIACSILSGRTLSPVAQIPSHLVSWANTKAAIKSLDEMWKLATDNEDNSKQALVEKLQGNYHIADNMQFLYADKLAIKVEKLKINAGEKIAILGSIGSGKTTLLRLLSGMYKPSVGKILLDGVNLDNISKVNLAEKIGFLQQDGRLFKGTLRENITLGLSGVSDEEILNISNLTNLTQSVINKYDKGLDFEIFEGGVGLSGGQKQLLNLTRLFLKQSKIWLLDEPTSSLDSSLELQIMQLLKQTLSDKDTLILITHKVKMLDLVDRIIVVNNNKIVMDGAKYEVLEALKTPNNDTKNKS